MFIEYPHLPGSSRNGRGDVAIRRLVPNAITAASLCCGLASMHYALLQDFDKAMFAILLAAVFDGLDGRAARLLKVTSPFGEVLDSLADFLSFGVAPAALLYLWTLRSLDVVGLAAAMSFVLCSALRLARFTAAASMLRGSVAAADIETQRRLKLVSLFFQGVPTPAAGVIVLIPAMLDQSKFLSARFAPTGLGGVVNLPVISAACCFVVALLMISQVRTYSFKKLRVPRFAVVPMLAMVGLVSVLMVKDVWLAMVALAIGYILTWPASIIAHRKLSTLPAQRVLEIYGPPAAPRRRRKLFVPRLADDLPAKPRASKP